MSRLYRPLFRSRKGVRRPEGRRRRRLVLSLVILAVGILILVVPGSIYLRELSSEIALSDATDLVTLIINDTIYDQLDQGGYDYDYFVNLEKDDRGYVTAITTNMSRINALSAELLSSIVDQSGSKGLHIRIPLGNLMGSNLLLGKGPEVSVEIIMLTSSRADFRNELVSAGINQTKHQILLELVVDIDVLIPWDTLSTQIVSEILVAETVIVGQVPEMYMEGN